MEIQKLVTEEGNELYSPLHDIFEKAMDRMPDWMRSHDLLDQWLFHDGGASRLFTVERTASVLVFSNIVEGLSADVTLLNPEEADAPQIYRELHEVMGAWSLKRLTSFVPGPVKDLQRILKEVGFRREGHMRRAAFWNGRLCGIDVYGLLKDRPQANKAGGRSGSEKRRDSHPQKTEPSPAEDAAPEKTADPPESQPELPGLSDG